MKLGFVNKELKEKLGYRLWSKSVAQYELNVLGNYHHAISN